MDKAIEELHHCLAEVNAEIGILLHKRVLDISDRNEDLMAEAKELRTQAEGLQAQLTSMSENAARETSKIDLENIENCRRALGDIPDKHRDSELCRKTLQGAFPEAMGVVEAHSSWSTNYNQMTTEILQTNAAYESWRNCAGSSLLVFSGSTSGEGRASQSSLCWLSPAALHIFTQFSSEGKRVAFHSCHPDFREQLSSSRYVVSCLLYQIIAWRPEVFRHKTKGFESAVNADTWTSMDIRVALQSHFSLLRRVLDLVSASEDIVLVLDRLDLCEGSKYLLLKALQNLTREIPRGLRIVVTMSRLSYDYDRIECRSFVDSGAEDLMFGKMDWDQRRRSY